MGSFRSLLERFEEMGRLRRVDKRVSSRFDVPSIVLGLKEKVPLIFEDVEGKGIPVAANILRGREELNVAMGTTTTRELQEKLIHAMDYPKKPTEVDDGTPHSGVLIRDLDKLPILTHFEGEAGPYITSSVVSARDERTGVENASVHRLQMLDKKRLAIRVVPRHLYALLKEAHSRGRALGVTISIGVPPAVMIASVCSPPFGVSEFGVASSLSADTKITRGRHVDARCPANSEIVIEGEIRPGEEVDEGPFTDVTETLDAKRKQPIVRILGIYGKKKPIYHGIIPSGQEHQMLMGIPREAAILDGVRKVCPGTKEVRLTPGGRHWLHAVISLENFVEGETKNVILAAFASHPSLKHAVVVGPDIDIEDPNDIEYAIATRFQGDKDLTLISGVRGSSLDPSSGKGGITCKAGVDATGGVEVFSARYRRSRPTVTDVAKAILDELAENVSD